MNVKHVAFVCGAFIRVAFVRIPFGYQAYKNERTPFVGDVMLINTKI